MTYQPAIGGQVLSPGARAQLARSALEQDQLGRLVEEMSPDERRAFWLGVLLMDRAVTINRARAIIEAGHRSPGLPAAQVTPAPDVELDPDRLCPGCELPMPKQTIGRPRKWCHRPECRRARQRTT